MNFYGQIVSRRKALFFTVTLLAAAGIAVMTSMPVSLFPDITFPRIVILADNGEQPAERMMSEVTVPLEGLASSLQGVRLVRSITGRGSTEISVDLDWGANVEETLQSLQGRLQDVRNVLPATVAIQAQQMRVSVFPIQGYSLTSDRRSLVELRDLALYTIRPALLQVKGIARVEITGGDVREYRVTVNPEKLAGYGLGVRQVSDAIARSNIVASTGILDNNYQMYLSLVVERLASVNDIGAVVVATRNGVPVHLSDVAVVSPSVADQLIRTTAHGHPAVLINVIRQPAGSTVQIGTDVDSVLAGIRLPSDVHFENFYDQSDFINSSISSTRDSIVIGVVLAMIVLLVFLRSWRVTIVIAVVVPVTIAATLLCLNAVGFSINIMTLGGMAAAVGLIIDDSIVVIEHIFARFNTVRDDVRVAESAFGAAARLSLHELMPAIIGSTASTLVIHIPLAFLGGITGAFFASLSITMVFALVLSFLLSISLAPLLASVVIRERDIERELKRQERRSGTGGWYERWLGWLLRHSWTVIPFALVMFAATCLVYSQVGSGFMPDMDEGSFVLDYESPPGTSLDETNRMLTQVEQILMKTPEVESYSRRTGTQMGFFLTEPNRGDYLVKLRKERSRSIDLVIDEVRTKIESSQPALRIDFGQLMQDVIGDLTNSPSPIEIKIFGSDSRILQAKAEEITRLIENVPGVVDAFSGIVITGPSFVVNLDPERAARAGLDATEVAAQLETIMRGSVGSTVLQGEKLVDIRVRYPDEYRHDIDLLSGVRLVNQQGIAVPLTSIATITKSTGQPELHREGLRRLVAVTARITGRDLGSTIADIKSRLAGHLTIPAGISIEYGGLYQTQQESFRGLVLVALAAFGLVFIVLLIEFGEFSAPVSILIINLLSLLGVVGALWITGVTLNISSMVGTIMVIGIVAENAIFILHEMNHLRAGGMTLDRALIGASRLRRRPILMTTMAAVLALLPLSLGIGAGAQMQQPLAIAVIGGFSMSSLLLFFGLPMVYRLIGGRRSGNGENTEPGEPTVGDAAE
ncbi:MAG: efflux RND transporter permease subunit [Bacteroidetes bacterium]|nr:efflux RND transporter permease subunit [Bacteroidota bacterium]